MIPFGSAGSLPVITYHYVNKDKANLTVSPSRFEDHCRILAENGWRGVSLQEAEEFLLHGRSLPRKSVLISLDDGYLDNYVYAWPILKKYGHHAVIFATAEMVQEAQDAADAQKQELRPTMEDLEAGRITQEQLPPVDNIFHETAQGHRVIRNLFFTWDEARAMEESGVIAVAAHSLRHEGIFTSPEYDGFMQPGKRMVSFPHEVRGEFWGCPRFTRGSELRDRAFLPNPRMLEELRLLVPQDEKGATEFFARPEVQDELHAVMARYADDLGRMETDEEAAERLNRVMQANQEILTKGLGHAVRSFCWPWGHSSPLALQAAHAAGFAVFYDVKKGPNLPGKAVGVRRMDFRQDPRVLLGRLKIYANPWLGEGYEKINKWLNLRQRRKK